MKKSLFLILAAACLALAACTEKSTPVKKEIPAESITLDKENVVVPVDEEVEIHAILVPEDARPVVWVSGDPSVATVSDEGVVTGKSLGETEIIAVCGKFLANCHVTVVTPIKEITLNEESVQIEMNKDFQLKAVITPDEATESIEWLSDKPEIATVDDIGHITAVGVGKATITAKAIHAEAKCEVEVIPIPVREIVLTPNNKELNVGETVQFSAAIAPEDAEDKSIVWSVETEGVVTIDEDGLVTAVGVGYAYIRATASNGVYARALVKVYGPVSVPFTEDFEDLDALYQWRVYNNDGDKHSWYYATESDHVSSHSGLHCLINYSYYGGDLTPDDWVVTPPVRLDAEYNQLGFWVWPYLTTWALEVYGAYIFTELSDEGPVNPTQLVKGTLTQGASEIYGSNSYVETVDGFEHVVVDIPEDFYGKTVYLAFRHFDCSGQYALLLDDVLVSNTPIEREAVEPEPSPAPKKPSLFRGDRAIPQNVRPFGHSIVK